MSILKRGTCDSSVVSSSSLYVCNSCGHTEMAKSGAPSKKCPKCEDNMDVVSSSASSASSGHCDCSNGKCSM